MNTNMKPLYATTGLIAVTIVLGTIALYFDANVNNYNFPLGNHTVSDAVFPEIIIIAAVSAWCGYLLDWRIGIITAVLLSVILFAETQTYIGNDFWHLIT